MMVRTTMTPKATIYFLSTLAMTRNIRFISQITRLGPASK